MRLTATLLIAALLPLSAAAADADADDAPRYVEGTHYTVLPAPVETASEDGVEVMEFFSYACPHCFTFDPQLSAWELEQADDVDFRRTPAIFNRMYQWFAQVYYTAESLGVLEASHSALFDLLHVQRQMPNSVEKLANFFADYGVTPEEFEKAFTSFGVRTMMQQAQARGQRYQEGGVSGVPTLIVDGKYVVDSRAGGGYEGMLEVVDWLVERERESAATPAVATSDN